MMKKTLTLLFTSLLYTSSFSQTTWNLQKCIEYAFENNISIKQADISKMIAQNNFLQSKLNLLPSISGDASLNYNFGNSVNPTTYEFIQNATNSSSYNLSANMTLFGGLQQQNNIKQNQYNTKAAEENLKSTQNNIALTISQYYLQILQNYELLDVAKKQLDQSKQQKEKIEIQISTGAVPAGSRYQSEAQIATDELRIVNAQNAVDNSKLLLKLILQLNPQQSFEIEIPTLANDFTFDQSLTAERIYSYAVTQQPSVKSAKWSLKSTERSLSMSKGAFSPSLSAYASLRTNYFNQQKTYTATNNLNFNTIGFTETSLERVIQPSPEIITTKTPYTTQLKQNLSEGLGLSLNVPIFSRWNRVTNMNNAKLQVANAELRLESTRNQLQQDIYQAYANYESARKTYEANQKNVYSLQKTYEFAIERFNVGALSQIDLSVIQNNLAVATSEFARSKYDYLFKIKILEFYQGKNLQLN
jgi:outer membrane protein